MSAAPHLVIAAGGTGGHMFPAQALAELMLARGWRVTLSTDARGARYAGGFPAEVVRAVVPAATFARGGLAAKMVAPLRIAAGVARAWAAMRHDRPACVAGFGGYPAIPALAAATALGAPRLIHEANGVLGRANELFAARVGAVACGVWPTALPRGARGVHVGNPVRAQIAAAAGAPYAPPRPDGPVEVLAVGGSQGARSVTLAVAGAVAALPAALRARLRLALQAREEDAAAVRATLSAAGVSAEVRPFFEDMADRLTRAHLVVARSGGSTVADLAVVGRPAVLAPLAAAIRDEQTANARPLVDAGAAVVLPEAGLTPETLASHLARLLGAPAELARMAAAAKGLGRPDAAAKLADLVERLAAGQPVEDPAP